MADAKHSPVDQHKSPFVGVEHSKTDKGKQETTEDSLQLNGYAPKWLYWCKCVATIIVVIASLGHVIRLSYLGDDTCKLLFQKGRWVGDTWQPFGCMMHMYTPREVRSCLRNNKVVFIGDSRVRQPFLRLQSTLNGQPPQQAKVHSDMTYTEKGNISLHFMWEPEVDEMMEERMVGLLESYPPSSVPCADFLKSIEVGEASLPHLLVIAAATWTIKAKPIGQFIKYQESLKRIKEHLTAMLAKVSKPFARNVSKTRNSIVPIVVWQYQDPVVERKLHQARQRITNEKIDLFNAELAKSLGKSPIKVLESGALLTSARPDATQDGLHYSPEIIQLELNIILNAFCNRLILPQDASCCMGAEHITKLQYNTFAAFVTCIVLWLAMFVCQFAIARKHKDAEAAAELERKGSWLYSGPMYVIMKALAQLALILLYFFLCDRSLLFFKEGKHFSYLAFGISLFIILLFGIGTKRDAVESTILNSEQIDEWRGWILVFFMLYNYSGAYEVLPAYVLAKLVVSSLLFIMGYEHFMYFWYSNDFGLYNVCKVVTRFNVLTVILCLVLGRPYEFYYFILLGTFWFLVIYIFMAMPKRVTAEVVQENPKMYVWMVAKFFAMFALTYIVWGYQSVAWWIFSKRVIRELFIDVNGSVADWVYRSSLDRYAVMCGMFVAFGVQAAKRYDVIDDGRANQSWLFRSKYLSVFANIVGVTCCVGYGIQAFTCHNRESCNATHSAGFIIPIIGFFLIRNASCAIRSKVSGFYVWLGRYYLEFFVAQFHIWLGGDKHGLLVFISNQPVFNASITSFVFIITVHELTGICNILSRSLVTKDVKIMLRRLCVAMVMLLIIWYHKTHDQKRK